MAAGIGDKFTKAFNSDNPNVARATVARSALATTLTCDSLTGWPTDTAVHFSTYRLDSSNEVTAGTQIDWKGIVSGNVIGSLTRLAGAADSGTSIGDVVEMNPTGSWASDLVDGLLVSLNQDGTIKDDSVSTAAIEDSAVTAAKLGDSGWINPTLENSYVVQNSRTVSYRKIGNRVYLRGQIGKATLDQNNMFTLPSGYRPSTACIYTVPGVSGNTGKITINTDGTILTPTPPPSSTYSGLDVISFFVD